MPIPVKQLAMAIENAIFRNYIERGMRIFTPHMFIADETGDVKAVMSVLIALCRGGVLHEKIKLRERGSGGVMSVTYDFMSLQAAYNENPSLRDAEVLYAFELDDFYIQNRLEAEIAETASEG